MGFIDRLKGETRMVSAMQIAQVLLLLTKEEILNVLGCLRVWLFRANPDKLGCYNRVPQIGSQTTDIHFSQFRCSRDGLWPLADGDLMKAPFWFFDGCLPPGPCWEEQALVSPILSGTPSS